MDKKKLLARKAKKNIDDLSHLLDITSDEIKPTEKSIKAQTAANKKWEEKSGVQAKTYKLNAKTVEMFGKACQISGKSQSEVLSAFMMAYAFIFSPPKLTITSPETE
jgi:hypothetical protein